MRMHGRPCVTRLPGMYCGQVLFHYGGPECVDANPDDEDLFKPVFPEGDSCGTFVSLFVKMVLYSISTSLLVGIVVGCRVRGALATAHN